MTGSPGLVKIMCADCNAESFEGVEFSGKFRVKSLYLSRMFAQVRRAVAELKSALRLFSQLNALGGHLTQGLDRKKVASHIEFCKVSP
jgi:hypothetical protein